jgi:DEAD/DEAH box helicase domain-containing protein
MTLSSEKHGHLSLVKPDAKADEAITRPDPSWRSASGIDSVLDRWMRGNIVKPCLTADRTYDASAEQTSPLPASIPPNLAAALRGRGIHALYKHQARAIEALSGGARALVVATPTASGKSLCFHLPVLKALADDPDARAIYLFPTKALARDQEASLDKLAQEANLKLGAVVYDGDTPADARRAAREKSRIVFTNPDMLHSGILPHHTTWARTFQKLAYVVVDELHMYKGVFGSHVANVLRRLRRIANFHGSNPRFIGATATIGNPKEHAARIFGLNEDEVVLESESGAPRGERRVFMFNPPVVNEELGIRASYAKQAVMLTADLVRAKVPTLLFGQSRNNVETMLRYLRDKVAGEIDPARIVAYRGGYLPGHRREIEQKLRDGEILGVVATNALELGIDIGDLDAVVCAGYPGSIAGTWQRFGRAGRRCANSIAVLVTSSAPLDQYLAREPEYFLGAPVEEARIDADNVEILIQHLKCGAFELPFSRGDSFGSIPAAETTEALEFLERHKVLHESNGAFHWATDSHPANNVSLRSIGWDNVVIVDMGSDKPMVGSMQAKEHPQYKVLAEIDWRGAHTMLHEQAIYQHDGETWQVEKFDYENHKAYVRKVDPDYFTDAMTHLKISVIEESAEAPLLVKDEAAWTSAWGEVAVVEKVVGYKKIKFYTHENAGYGDVRLPEMQMHTTSFWLKMPSETLLASPFGRAAVIDGLRGIGRALETVSAVALMCDPRDLGISLADEPQNSKEYDPTLFIYEHTPGGIGLASRIFEHREVLLARALRLIETCTCNDGCPACVGPGDIGFDHERSRKRVAIDLLKRVSGA